MTAIENIESLVNRIYYDDAIAYKELYVLYHQKLLQFSYTITHSRVHSEEIVSDVFLKIWLKRKTLLKVRNLHLYLYISTKNLSINSLAKQKKEKTITIAHPAKVEFTSFYFDPEQILINAETLRRIQFAILQLPPQCQLIFKLIKEDGLKYKEVAHLLNLSVKTIESQMSIALKKIANSIQFNLARVSAG